MSLVYRVAGVTAALTILAGCSGGGSHTSALPSTGGTTQSKAVVPTVFKVIIPTKTTSANVRVPKYISPATQSISIAVNGGAATTQNITTGSAGCTTPTVISPTTCTITVNAPPGPDSFVIDTFDGMNGTGNVLSALTFNQTINPGQANIINVSLGGIPVSLTVTPMPDSPYLIGSTLSGFTSYYDQPQHIAVVSYDADGNPIVGTGVPTLGITNPEAGLTVTAPVAGASQNVFTVQNKTGGFNMTQTLAVTATPVAGSGGTTLTQNVSVVPKHIIAYVASRGTTPSLSVFYDDSTTPARTPITLVSTASGMFTDDHGDVYVTSNDGTLREYTITAAGTTTPAFTFASGINSPGSGCVDHENNIYVATNGSPNSVEEFAPNGVDTVTNTYMDTIAGPATCVIDADDSLWVLNNPNDGVTPATVSHFAAGSTTHNAQITLSGATTNFFLSLAIDRSGTLYVGYTNAQNSPTQAAIQVFPKGATSEAFELPATPGEYPNGISVDIGGALWVSTFDFTTNENALRYGPPINSAASPSTPINYGLPGMILQVAPKAIPSTE